MTLGKFYTLLLVPLLPFTKQYNVVLATLCGWEGNRIGLVSHRLSGLPTYGY